MAASKKVLIANFSFPPSPGIGGRRWAKFAKYLQRNGHQVWVLAARNEGPRQSDWVNDVRDIRTTYVPTGQPRIFFRPAQSLADRIRFRLATLWVKCRVKGNYFDKSALMRRPLQEAARKLIRDNQIETVIASGAPFHFLSFLLELKAEFPQVKFIIDFRDVWTTDDSISNFKFLSASRFAHEKALEHQVIASADAVLGVAPAITEYFRGLSKSEAKPFHTLENGYDSDDFAHLPAAAPPAPGGLIRFVFTGTFYPETENLWHPLIGVLQRWKAERPDLYARLRFDFYGSMRSSFLSYATDRGVDAVQFHGAVSLAEVYRHIREASYCLLILHDLFAFSLSTKFCEYVSQHKKIAVLSREGETSKFVTEHGLGYWLDPAAVEKGLLQLVKEWDNGQALQWAPTFDVTYYSLESLTRKLEGWL